MPSTSTTTTHIARVPYLNSVPFFRGLSLGGGHALVDCVPKALELHAAEGALGAGLMPVAGFFRLQESFERLGKLGLAVRGRARSALLFSRKPIRQLEGATIAMTPDTSTTRCLLRLLLEQRYELRPASYLPAPHRDAEALLLIGDEALRFKQANALYPFETDLAFEWWLWQHLPFVFAVWAIRKDANPQEKKQLELMLTRALSINLGDLDAISKEHAPTFGMPEAEVRDYLEGFSYRLGKFEEEGMQRFKDLVDEHRLL